MQGEALYLSTHCTTCLKLFKKLLNLDIMQAQIDIEFDQLVQIAKKLPAQQWKKLKAEVEASSDTDNEREEFKKFLLNGPTFTKKQLNEVAKARKEINQWRKN